MLKSRKTIYSIILVLILLVVTGVSYVLKRQKDSTLTTDSTTSSSGSVTSKEIAQTVFVPVTKLKSYEKVISFLELSKRKLFILDDYQEEVVSLFPDGVDVEVWTQSIEDLSTYINESDDNTIAILPIDLLDIRFKVLQVEGVDVFSKDFSLDSYPLVSKIERIISLPSDGTSSGDITISNWNPERYTRFFAGGEIITGRGVDLMWLQRGDDNFEFLFDRIKDDISSADLAVALLEHSYHGDPVPCPRCTSFVGDEKLIPQLKNVGFDLFSLAGNHIGDGGIEAEYRTRELLTTNDLRFFGAGDNLSLASSPVITEVNGINYAFLAADDIATFYWAGEDSPGENRFSMISAGGVVIDENKVRNDISKAKDLADKVIVYMSWGVEYTNYATEHQQELAHLLIDAGADLVIASHPHWVQNFEIYDGKLIMYSMGNLIFDQTHTDPTREAIYMNLNFYDGELINFELVPILTCGYHYGANNLAYDVLAGNMSYDEVDSINESSACVWLQPKPLEEDHPKYKVILDRVYEYSEF